MSDNIERISALLVSAAELKADMNRQTELTRELCTRVSKLYMAILNMTLILTKDEDDYVPLSKIVEDDHDRG